MRSTLRGAALVLACLAHVGLAADPLDSWTQNQSGTTNRLTSVTYGSGRYVAVGAAGTILSSTNGVGWTQCESGTTNQASTNLRDWTLVTEVTTTNGTAQVSDPIPTNSLQRFYRAVTP